MPQSGVVLEFEGFQVHGGLYIIKELAIHDLATCANVRFLFQAPYPRPSEYKKTIKWVTKNMHGFSWNRAGLSYECLPAILKTVAMSSRTIYVKGGNKISF